MTQEIHQLVQRLGAYLQDAKKPQILWEEMKLLAHKAFEVQETLTERLEVLEKEQTDFRQVQLIFDIRENVWDIMAQIAVREKNLKEKTHAPARSRQAPAAPPKRKGKK